MKLTGEMFQEILARLTSDNSAGFHNKRQEPRVGVRVQGIITPWTLDENCAKGIPVTIRDLSAGGICLLSRAAVQPGARFVLQLQRSQGGVLHVNYEVRYCKKLASTLFCIGGKLGNMSDDSPETCAA